MCDCKGRGHCYVQNQGDSDEPDWIIPVDADYCSFDCSLQVCPKCETKASEAPEWFYDIYGTCMVCETIKSRKQLKAARKIRSAAYFQLRYGKRKTWIRYGIYKNN